MKIDILEINKHLDWLKEKIKLNSFAANAQSRIVFRGEVYECNFGIGVGSEERKKRPCVILQNDIANKKSPIVLVAPISHTSSNNPVVVSFPPKYDTSGNIILDGYVLVGNMTSVSKARLGNKIAKMSKQEMNDIEQAIIIQAGLLDKFNSLNNIIKDKDVYIEKLKNKENLC